MPLNYLQLVKIINIIYCFITTKKVCWIWYTNNKMQLSKAVIHFSNKNGIFWQVEDVLTCWPRNITCWHAIEELWNMGLKRHLQQYLRWSGWTGISVCGFQTQHCTKTGGHAVWFQLLPCAKPRKQHVIQGCIWGETSSSPAGRARCLVAYANWSGWKLGRLWSTPVISS